MTEQNIQNAIRIALSSHGTVFRTNSGKAWQGTVVYDPERRQNILINLRRVELLPEGFSDLLFIGKNKTAFIETKRPGEKPKPHQEKFLELMRGYGHRADVARSVEDALKIIGGDGDA